MDFLKIWHGNSRTEGLWHLLRFLNFIFLFYKDFPQNIGFLQFGGQKLKILKFWDNCFVERVILHLHWSFCAVCFKNLFLANFLTLSRFWSKLAWSDPTKTSIFQQKKNPADFNKTSSFDVKWMKHKVHQILCRYLWRFWSYSENPGGGKFCPRQRGAG